MKKSIVVAILMSLVSVSAAKADFVDGRFTVLDTTTNYEWEKNVTPYNNWYDSMGYCENLELDGHDDWVLPMPAHLKTIRNAPYFVYNYNFYMTRKEYNDTLAYGYNLDTGAVPVVGKTALGNMRCMRDASVDYTPVVTYVTIQKTGYYTMEAITGGGMVSAYVDGVMMMSYNSTYITGTVGIGSLVAGQTLELHVNDQKADSIDELDWQSWNMYFSSGEVVIYVEDPPMPEVCEPEVIVNTVYVEVPAVCDDGNNGHGNDPGKVDASNPGKKVTKRNRTRAAKKANK